MSLNSVTPAQLVGHVKSALSGGDKARPAFTLIIGAGFSAGLVPLTREMMRAEIGPSLSEQPDAAPERKRELTVEFWRKFNDENRRYDTGCTVALDGDGLPIDPTTAYQTVSDPKSLSGVGTVEEVRRFLRAMVAKSRGRLNGAHFFLGAILDAQRRGELAGKRPFCRTIFTTNFDPLLQTCLQLMGLLYYMTDRPELSLTSSHMEEDDNAIHLIYTHGSVHRPYLANTQEELIALRANAPIFRPYLEKHGVIVIGYSGWDDSLLAALEECANFEANLYWCDIFPSPEAEKHLSEHATHLLASARGRRFYVPLGPDGADGLMGQLFQELVPSRGIPALLIDPFSGLAERLGGLNLKGLILKRYGTTSAPEAEKIETLQVDADELLTKAVDALTDASERLSSGEAAVSPAEAVRHLLSAALERALAGRIMEAIALWDAVIELPGAPPQHVGMALYNRGFTFGQQGEAAKAIDDYTRVIELPGAPPGHVARAFNDRGLTYSRQGDVAKAMDDYRQVTELPGAPPDQIGRALYNRGLSYTRQGETTKAIDDYTRVIDLPGAPPDQVAKALNNRGVAFGRQFEMAKAIEDYTRVIELPGAPPDQVAVALFKRGLAYRQQGDTKKEIADYTRVIELPGAPPDQVASALNNRGVTYRRQGDAEKAIADYTRVIELPSALPDQVASAFNNRGVAYRQEGDTEKAIADYTRVTDLPGAPPDQVAGALHNRGWARYSDGEGDPALFLADADASVRLEPRVVALGNLGLARLFAGQDNEALEAYRQSIERRPSKQELDEMRADVTAAVGKWLDQDRAAPILALLETTESARAQVT